MEIYHRETEVNDYMAINVDITRQWFKWIINGILQVSVYWAICHFKFTMIYFGEIVCKVHEISSNIAYE